LRKGSAAVENCFVVDSGGVVVDLLAAMLEVVDKSRWSNLATTRLFFGDAVAVAAAAFLRTPLPPLTMKRCIFLSF
jgi:hypothetical protein